MVVIDGERKNRENRSQFKTEEGNETSVESNCCLLGTVNWKTGEED